MKAHRLLLTRREMDESFELAEFDTALCERQVRKVLAVLLREAKRTEATTYVQEFMERVISETGLTQPAKG